MYKTAGFLPTIAKLR